MAQLDFIVADLTNPYNAILDKQSLHIVNDVMSLTYLTMKFPTPLQ